MISLEKLKILTPLQNLPKNVGDLGPLIVAKGFKKLPKVQKISISGHTDWEQNVTNTMLHNRKKQPLGEKIFAQKIVVS